MIDVAITEDRNINPLTPNDPYSGRTAQLTSKRSILYIYSTNIGTEYFKHGVYSPFISLQKLIHRKDEMRKLLLSFAELHNDLKATMIQRFVFPQHIHVQKEWDYA